MTDDDPLTTTKAWRIYGEAAHNLGDAAMVASLYGLVGLVAAALVGYFVHPWLGFLLAIGAGFGALRAFGVKLKSYGTTLATKASRGQTIS